MTAASPLLATRSVGDGRPVWRLSLGLPNELHGVCIFVGFLLLFHLRSPDSLALPQFWAEDGATFFAAAFAGNGHNVVAAYAGYMHLLPRLVAWLAYPAFGVLLQPLLYNMAALLACAFSASALFLHLRRAGLSGWAAVLVFALPVSAELLGTLTNVQWFLQIYLAGACAFGLLGRVWWTRALELLFIAVAAATGPFSVFYALALLPLYLIAQTRPLLFALPRTALLVHAALLPTVIAQAWSLSQAAGGRLVGERTVAELIGFIEHIPLQVLGIPAPISTALLAIMLVISLGFLLSQRAPHSARLLLLLLYVGAAIQVAGTALTDANIGLFEHSGYSGRYFFLFRVAAFLGVFFAIIRWLPRPALVAPALCAALLWGMYAHSTGGHFTRPPLPDKDWPEQARLIEAGGARAIDINPTPYHFPPGPKP